MIDLYYWPTPNGRKITILLEELNLDYRVFPININTGEQFSEEFLRISPNNKIPAIVLNQNGEKICLFESGAIMIFLAEKYQKFLSNDFLKRYKTFEWLTWQVGGFGPMLGQAHHFNFYAKSKIDYAISRYSNEAKRLYNVLNKRLENRDWIIDEYSIADMAIFPWTRTPERQGVDLNDFSNVIRWRENMISRKAVKIGMSVSQELRKDPDKSLSKEEHDNLFGENQYKKR
tara:strand:- start:454 stop:1146 length:693 start_codon:yes stop_codon:yes gene_type:complete